MDARLTNEELDGIWKEVYAINGFSKAIADAQLRKALWWAAQKLDDPLLRVILQDAGIEPWPNNVPATRQG